MRCSFLKWINEWILNEFWCSTDSDEVRWSIIDEKCSNLHFEMRILGCRYLEFENMDVLE